VIVVDNGSTDGTREYVAGVHDACPVPVTVITNIDDLRFHFLLVHTAQVANCWDAIELLHIDTDPHTKGQTCRWFGAV
jgi:hypothetical protein